jgi:hypothetical protein
MRTGAPRCLIYLLILSGLLGRWTGTVKAGTVDCTSEKNHVFYDALWELSEVSDYCHHLVTQPLSIA